jgi:hypothetical protein
MVKQNPTLHTAKEYRLPIKKIYALLQLKRVWQGAGKKL